MAVLTSLIVLCLLVSTAFSVLEFDIDFSLSGGKIDNFWSSTGLTPQSPCERDLVVEQMLSLDMNTNIGIIGSLPNQVINVDLSLLTYLKYSQSQLKFDNGQLFLQKAFNLCPCLV